MEVSLYNKYTEQVINVVINQLQDLHNIIEAHFNIQSMKQIIRLNGIIIDTKKDMVEYDIKDQDMLIIEEGLNHEYFDMAQETMISNSLLYLKARINEFSFKAMVDTGAQTNVMSIMMVRTLRIEHLIDKTFVGMAKGVGSAKILGVLFQIPILIGDIEIKTNFKVMDTEDKTNSDLVLLGLEFILCKCSGIDFIQRQITIKGKPIKFLNEKEIQKFEQPINEKEYKLRLILKDSYDCMGSKQVRESIGLIQKIIGNIISNPEKPKYRAIRLDSKMVEQNILRFIECIRLMEEIGFEFEDKEIVYKKKDLKKLEDFVNIIGNESLLY